MLSRRLAFLICGIAACLWPPEAKSADTQVAIVSRTVFYVPVWIADRLGYLREEGINPSITVYDNAEKITADLRAGAVQISISPPESAIADAVSGGPLRIVAGNAGRLPHFIITKPSITALSQLRGARIGVLSLNEGTTFLVKELARRANLNDGDYQIVPVGGAPTRWRLLQSGAIDAGLQPFPLSYEAEAAGFNNLGPVADYIPDYQFTAVIVDSTWAQQNGPTVAGFLRALARGTDYMASHPDETAEIAAQELQTSVMLARRALNDAARLNILSTDLSVSTAGVKYVFETLKGVGAISPDEVFDIRKLVDDRYLLQSRSAAP